ncbi:MAG: hypothetical protein R3336_03815 [Phycisphaeraceae bacterium]|nr:hypothetical protein [Phycisphaeraceae bacterium]
MPRSFFKSFLIALLAATLTTTAAADPASSSDLGVRLEGVPDALQLPMPEGANQMITATLVGEDEATAGWISPVGHPAVRLMMSRTGEHTFQANLGDPTLAQILKAVDADAFHVVLTPRSGPTVKSVRINVGRRGYVRIPRPTISGKVILTDHDDPHSYQPGHWYDAAKVTGMTILLEPSDGPLPDPLTVTATIGKESFDLTPTDDATRWTLQLKGHHRRDWQATGNLTIHVQTDDRWLNSMRWLARPGPLVPADQGQTFVAAQRSTHALPGSNGFLRAHLGDITAGQVHVSVTSMDDPHTGLAHRSLRPGQSLTFEYDEIRYEVRVKKLMNQLIGTDHAELELRRADPETED